MLQAVKDRVVNGDVHGDIAKIEYKCCTENGCNDYGGGEIFYQNFLDEFEITREKPTATKKAPVQHNDKHPFCPLYDKKKHVSIWVDLLGLSSWKAFRPLVPSMKALHA